MVREIVLGDLWGIDESVWVDLWAGLLGAIPAAIISAGVAAGVAVSVLGRTNEHQRKLATEAATEQRETALRQMDVQQRLAADQLNEQRTLSEKQLAEQRRESDRVRERGARAEVLVACEGFEPAARKSIEAVREHLSVFQSAGARWRLELRGQQMQTELNDWGTILLVTAATWARARARAGGDGYRGEEAATLKILRRAVSMFSGVLLFWPDGDIAARRKLTETLGTYSDEIMVALNELPDGVWLPR